MRYALVKVASGFVENVVEIDDLGDWPTPDGYQVVATDTASIGWAYKEGTFTEPAQSSSGTGF